MAIKFGTDGWRGIIGEDYTFENVRLCAQGTAQFFKRQGLASRGLVVGYDTRFASEDFAAAVAEIIAANGITTYLCDRPAPTPVVSYNVVALDCGGGVVITASHNPARWNGFKYKPDYGGSATAQIVGVLESEIAEAGRSQAVSRMSLADAESKGLLEYVDPKPAYLGHIASTVELQAIRQAGLNVVVDSMFGAGAGYFAELLAGGTTTVTELRQGPNPSFPGMSQPEPIANNLELLMSSVTGRSADVGLATDGDADRLGVVDEKGRFLTTLQTFAMLCLHLLEVLQRRGPIVRSMTMTNMVNKLGAIYDVPVFETPVGFKHLGPVMMRENAIAAGEESGGYAFGGNIPERDGILSGLLFLDMMVKTGKTPSELLDMLIEKVGPHHYDRLDLGFDESERDAIQSRVMTARPSTLAGRRVETFETQDGFLFGLEGGYWTLVRFSGTEPLLRIYAEGESPAEVATLLEEARTIADV